MWRHAAVEQRFGNGECLHHSRHHLLHAGRTENRDLATIGELPVERDQFSQIADMIDVQMGDEHLFDLIGLVAGLGEPADATLTAIDEIGVPRSEEHTSELQSLMRISYA